MGILGVTRIIAFLLVLVQGAVAFQTVSTTPPSSRYSKLFSSTWKDFDVTTEPTSLVDSSTFAVDAKAPLTLPPELGSQKTAKPITIAVEDNNTVAPSETDVWTGRILVMAASAMYGTNFPIVKMLDESLPSSVSAGLRFTLAAVVVTTIVLANEEKAMDESTAKERLQSTIRGMEVGGWYCIGYICQALALTSVEAGKCAFFGALAVIIVPLLDAVFKKVSLSRTSITAIVFAISGVGLIELGHGVSALQVGDLLSLAMAATFAFGYWRLEDVATSYPHMASRTTMGQLIAVAIGTVGYAVLGYHWNAYDSLHMAEQVSNPTVLGQLAWTGLGSTALALYLETIALKAITASELTVLMTSTSLWASGFAYLGLGEVLTPMAMGGGAFILAGCVINAVGGGFNHDNKQKSDDDLTSR